MQLIWAGRPRLSFWLKLLAAGGLVALADQLFFGKGVGATLGGFAVIWTAAAVALVPPIRRNTTARIAAGAAVLLCVVLFNHPSLTGWTLFWIALTVAVLSPRCAWAGDGWSWTQRVSTHAWLSFVGPIQDSRRLRRLIPPSKISLQALMAMSALPLGGGAIFLALFASANPIIAQALFRGIYQDRVKILIGIGLIYCVLVVLSGLVSRGISRPIEALSAASRRVAAGQGDVPETPQTAALEIRDLYRDFRAMAEAIARRSRYLKDFAAAVSHEFKTPLAGIRGATELLQDHQAEMSEGDRRRFLGNIAADTERLSQLVTRLLDLARADMARPEAGVAVDARASILRIADALGAERLAIHIDLPPHLPPVAVPASTLEAVLTTLIDNSRQAGASSVTIKAGASSGTVVVSVADDGRGVPQGDRDRLFEPFFTTKREEGGSGLGLSIARSLLAASQGEIRLAPSLSGACFEITAPIASSG